ncbi:hypothetical protein ABZ234_10160 [Nocardiopsis sp. NPDC006198]|uniref:hypothetical protein n=1 Tax=Nocardiopsis sp. NPDC006198 TaxID=3154472 RepID=UPI0033B542A7
MTVRMAVILIGAAGCAALAGALRLVDRASWPEAAGAALGAAVGLLATVVKGEDPPSPR